MKNQGKITDNYYRFGDEALVAEIAAGARNSG